MKDIFTESERHYISLLQESINRMASNSANCKTWLLTLVAAILALQLTREELRIILWIALGLIVLFYVLDSYYLGLERKFRSLEKSFVEAVKQNETDDIYSFNIKSVNDKRSTTCSALWSSSTWPFYGILFLAVLLVCLWPKLSFICS